MERLGLQELHYITPIENVPSILEEGKSRCPRADADARWHCPVGSEVP